MWLSLYADRPGILLMLMRSNLCSVQRTSQSHFRLSLRLSLAVCMAKRTPGGNAHATERARITLVLVSGFVKSAKHFVELGICDDIYCADVLHCFLSF